MICFPNGVKCNKERNFATLAECKNMNRPYYIIATVCEKSNRTLYEHHKIGKCN